MNWHRIANIAAGLLVVILVGVAIAAFVHLNTPEKGVFTLEGFGLIVCPVLGAGFISSVRWCHRKIIPAASGLTTSQKLKRDTLDGLRKLNSRLSRAGLYGEVNVIAGAEKQLGDMFKQ